MSSSSTISSSLRLFTSQIPRSLFPHRTSSVSASPKNPFKNPSFIKFISFQSIPTNQSSISASASASTSMHLQPIGELPPRLQEIVKLFQSVQEPKAKYQQLLFYGKNLKPLDARFKTKQNKVEGCVSQVWVRAYLDSGRNVVYEADSDSALTKGLAALLVDGLSGRPVEEVLRVSPDFAILLGLQQSLTPSRNNGFLNMLKLMQNKALELLVEAENGSSSVQSSNLELDAEAGVQEENNFKSETVGEFSNGRLSTKEAESATMSTSESESKSGALGSRGKRIRERLEKELSPIELQVEDISYQHAGHAGVRGSNGETHFNVKVVSKEFEGKSLVKRHRLIYKLLQGELQNGLHALSIVAKTPGEVDRA